MRVIVRTGAPHRAHTTIRFQLREGIGVKLEMDLIRDLLLYVEKHAERPESDLENIELKGWSQDQVAYHVILAKEDGLLKATVEKIPDDKDPIITHVGYTVHRLTPRGHELLGVIRVPKHWRTIKDGSKKAGVATIGALVSYGEAYAKVKINEYLGIGHS